MPRCVTSSRGPFDHRPGNASNRGFLELFDLFDGFGYDMHGISAIGKPVSREMVVCSLESRSTSISDDNFLFIDRDRKIEDIL